MISLQCAEKDASFARSAKQVPVKPDPAQKSGKDLTDVSRWRRAETVSVKADIAVKGKKRELFCDVVRRN